MTRPAAFAAGALTFTALAVVLALLLAATVIPVLHQPGWSLLAGGTVTACGLGGGILRLRATAPRNPLPAAGLYLPAQAVSGGLPGHAESAAELTGLAEWLEDERAGGQPDAELLRVAVAAMGELAGRIRDRAPAWWNL
jgi:hypothetical protein